MSQVEICKCFFFCIQGPYKAGTAGAAGASCSVLIRGHPDPTLSAVPDSRRDFMATLAVVRVTWCNNCVRDASSTFNWLLVICASERLLIKATKAPVGED